MKKIFLKIFDHWKNDWENRQLLFWLEFFMTIFAMIAELILVLGFRHKELLILSFSFSGISTFLMMIISYIRQSSWTIVLMIFFFSTNIIGLINLFLYWNM
jgi:hypothetical protein